MEITFCELKSKDVVNIYDGQNYGNLIDLSIDTRNGKVLGIIVPASNSFFHLFKNNNNIFIPINRICKIGKDIILVDIIIHSDKVEINKINDNNQNQLNKYQKQQQNEENKNKNI